MAKVQLNTPKDEKNSIAILIKQIIYKAIKR